MTIEVFADVLCPFTHLGLLRLVEHRSALGRDDVRLHVRAWPLEVVNGVPLDAEFVAEEIDEIRRQVAPEAFAGFDVGAFPATSLPALAVANAANRQSVEVGEAVSLELRRLLFEEGVDISDPHVLDDVASRHDLDVGPADAEAVLADHREGVERGVVGSPFFFTPGASYFCPALEVGRDDEGRLRVSADADSFDRFVANCFP